MEINGAEPSGQILDTPEYFHESLDGCYGTLTFIPHTIAMLYLKPHATQNLFDTGAEAPTRDGCASPEGRPSSPNGPAKMLSWNAQPFGPTIDI